MKVLTIHQPWASLIALGIKTIETRSWRAPSLIGERIAIHAAKRHMDGNAIFEFDPILHVHALCFTNVPLGAIVCTAVVTDCLPMLSCDETLPPGHCAQHSDTLFVCTNEMHTPLWRDSDYQTSLDDQLPYGDFRPGRWAWMLADIEPLAEPVPFKGGQGLSREWTP